MSARLEHVNICVRDPKASAAVLQSLFDWEIRWQGASGNNGYSVHVGSDAFYVALYAPGHDMQAPAKRYEHWNALNHIGVVVEDIDAAETRVRDAGYRPEKHADYEPGRRFYFGGPDGMEYEVVSYA